MNAVLVEQRDIAADVRHFVFDVPEVERLEFTPGQFVSLAGEVKGRKVTRAYSICSPPGGNRFELCLNRVKEGTFSPFMFELQPGGAVGMKGPLGDFVLRHPVSDSVFVAIGTGIAPFRAMLHDLLPRDGEHRFTLLFGVRYEEGILYRPEFEALAARHANFHFRSTLSRPAPGWAGLCGRVQIHLQEAVGDRRDLDVYVCGLKAMVDDVRGILKSLGFDRRRIIREKYD